MMDFTPVKKCLEGYHPSIERIYRADASFIDCIFYRKNKKGQSTVDETQQDLQKYIGGLVKFK